MKTFSIVPSQRERREGTACVMCGETETRVVWDCGTFSFARCRRCGHHFQNPRPVFDDLKARYDAEYFQYEIENAEGFLSLMRMGLVDVKFFDEEPTLRAAGAFLDVGCATGALLAEFRDRNWAVQGIELCEPAARYGIEQRRVPIHVGTLDDAPFAPETFSAVHSSHVIEHVPDPRAFVRRIHELLQPGGVLVLVTPDRSGAQARLFQARWRSAIADHLNLFSAAHLRALLHSEGFAVERTRSWGGLAAGVAPTWLKRPADRLAKWLNVGDVMAVRARRLP